MIVGETTNRTESLLSPAYTMKNLVEPSNHANTRRIARIPAPSPIPAICRALCREKRQWGSFDRRVSDDERLQCMMSLLAIGPQAKPGIGTLEPVDVALQEAAIETKLPLAEGF